MYVDLEGAKIIVTGGSRGIGAACVRRFREEGARVAFIYNRSEEAALELSHEVGAVAIKGSVGQASIAGAMKIAVDSLGGVDVLVNNAGIAQFGLFDEITDGDWEKMIETNLGGVFRCTRAVVPHMIRNKRGSIVNVSSMWGEVGASCEAHYSAAKAGVIGLTKSLAKELGPSGIRVNCITPGAIRTDMNAHLSADDVRALADGTPLCRLGEPEEVANCAAFLASAQASYITGAVVPVNGGYVT